MQREYAALDIADRESIGITFIIGTRALACFSFTAQFTVVSGTLTR
jgi:hypothetical protein